MTKSLIVESPTKAKTLKKYLGAEYKVFSSKGHVRDLPKSDLGVDIEHNFEPKYENLSSHAAVIKELKSGVKGTQEILLAPDPDREGEAIAWHLAELLKSSGLPVKRVEFREITKSAVLKALQNPSIINHDRVDAQQARRILDRLVGYKISPLMWKKVGSKLRSAGRVQSVAVKLICDRELEFKNFISEEYWSIAGEFATPGGTKFPSKLFKINDKDLQIPNQATVDGIVEDIKKQQFKVDALIKKQSRRNPAPPFITSTLQQEANRRFGFSGKITMKIAQQLYEGIDLGGETEGLITYMRTDSVRVSDDAQRAAAQVITDLYGSNYLPDTPNFFKAKRAIQDAHEAIRPTKIHFTPEHADKYLTTEQAKLYRLIWQRFVASQMTVAIFDDTVLDVVGGVYRFRTNQSVIAFAGFLRVFQDFEPENGDSNNGENVEKFERIPTELKVGENVFLLELLPEQHFTKPPPRYTDATLIKALEENGIGRPSTYAPIIDTILSRNYILREKKSLVPTEFGFAVVEFMLRFFPEIIDLKFTSTMEFDLDKIEKGETKWDSIVQEFWNTFSKQLEQAESSKDRVKIKAQVAEDVICPKCSSEMVYRWSKQGRFLGCSKFPACDGTFKLDRLGKPVANSTKLESDELDQICPKCNVGKLQVKTSKWGTKFISCNKYPKCDYTSELQTTCPKCNKKLNNKILPNRKKIRYCIDEKKCGFSIWGSPRLDNCPLCGYWLAERKNAKTNQVFVFCSNTECTNNKGLNNNEE